MTRPLIIGLGSHCADDRAGWLVLDRLQMLGFADDRLRRLLVPIDILDLVHGTEQLVICDACQGTGPPGTIHRWSWPADPILPVYARGTHDLGLAEVLELGRGLGMTPPSVDIWGIEGHAWLPGMDMGNEVCAAVEVAATAIWEAYSDA